MSRIKGEEGIPQLKITSKPKFDKHKCYKCKYHCENSSGYPVRTNHRTVRVCCDYATMMRETCLTKDENDNVIDKRGNDYRNCKLFEAGRVSAVSKSKRSIECI